MLVIGVIDLLDGLAVHARGGDRAKYAPVQRVEGDPVRLARGYLDAGLSDIYVADLGAIQSGQRQDSVIRALAAAGGTMWLDAGVSSVDAARACLGLGASRVVVGLETLRSFADLDAICGSVGGDRVAFSIDLRNGLAVGSDDDAETIARRAAAAGATAVIVLDLARVGTRAGLDLELLRGVRSAVPDVVLLAGGGVRGREDLTQLSDVGCHGALVATAFHDGRLDPADFANLEPRTSNLERRTSNVERRTSNVEHRTSNTERRTEREHEPRSEHGEARTAMVIGWDIGGVNTKVARVAGGRVLAVRTRPFELQRDPTALVRVLRELAAEVGVGSGDRHAVTMTAELSQMFRTKREGVSFVLDAVETAFAGADLRVFTVRGGFIGPPDAKQEPLAVAAANWVATAMLVGRHHPDALLIDIGTTTTDIIPIVGGDVVAAGRTDPERLASGELVYTGVLRTPVEAIAAQVPFRGAAAGVSAEGFALAGDVHVWRGDLAPADYSVPTPDGRPATREFAGERLARTVCADRELIDEAGITAIADALSEAQVVRITNGIRRVVGRHPQLKTAVVTGLGAFLGTAAARAAGLDVVSLAEDLGHDAARSAPAACVALMAEAERPLAVVKLGGSLLRDPARFDTALRGVSDLAAGEAVLVVPGGGPFADAVRYVDHRVGLSDDAAHWAAILGMNQYAHVIAARLPRAAVVQSRAEIASALAAGSIPVLAPSQWLRAADPLPHSWDVTSDSIAAWVAGTLEAHCLILVKPMDASGPDAVDRQFSAICPPTLKVYIVSADAIAGQPAR